MRIILLLALLFASPALAATSRSEPLILAFGDSLSAGYNLDRGAGFVPQLQAALRARGIAASVADGAVSGDTTSGGRARLDWTLAGLPLKPDLVIIELGANDMLRIVDLALTRANLDAMLTELDRRHIPVLIAGMRAAPTLDRAYRARFEAIFPELARKHRARRYAFFLDGVTAQPGMTLSDSLHPSPAGVKRIVSGILPDVLAALKRR